MHQTISERSSKNLQDLVVKLEKEIQQIGADKDSQIRAA
jgi:hypothetical protein